MARCEQGPKPIDVRGNYSGARRVTIRTHQDLLTHGIYVSPSAVEATWGKEAAEEYTTAYARRRVAQMGAAGNKIG